MAANVAWAAFYLGNVPDLDPDENTPDSENAFSIVNGVLGSPSDHFSNRLMMLETSAPGSWLTVNNIGGTGSIDYDSGSGPVTQTLDSIIQYNVSVIHPPNNTTLEFRSTVVQMENGDAFLLAPQNTPELHNLPIVSMQVHSVQNNHIRSIFQPEFEALSLVTCLTPGTWVRTTQGSLPVERLTAGMQVETVDHGPQPLRWIGKRQCQLTSRVANCKPVEIKADAICPGVPAADMRVSPQHRIWMEGQSGGYLLAAKHLLCRPGFRIMKGRRKETYFSLMFDRHELIFANDLITESFYPGPQAIRALPLAQRAAVFALFPRLARGDLDGYGPPVRPVLTRSEFERLQVPGARMHLALSG